jgi:hypothetical protein
MDLTCSRTAGLRSEASQDGKKRFVKLSDRSTTIAGILIVYTRVVVFLSTQLDENKNSRKLKHFACSSHSTLNRFTAMYHLMYFEDFFLSTTPRLRLLSVFSDVAKKRFTLCSGNEEQLLTLYKEEVL